MCVCARVRVHVCMYVCMYVCVCTYVCMCVCMYIYAGYFVISVLEEEGSCLRNVVCVWRENMKTVGKVQKVYFIDVS
jgi:hypothetical protein